MSGRRNMVDWSDLWQFQESLPDGKVKELLRSALFDLSDYEKIGSVRECSRMKELMDVPYSQIAVKFEELVKCYEAELEAEKRLCEIKLAKKDTRRTKKSE